MATESGRTPARLPPLKNGTTHARSHLAAAQYFEEHDIRAHFTTLTQMLLVHQPKNALRFMHNEIGRIIEQQEKNQGVDYSAAISKDSCLLRVHAEYEGPEGKRKQTFTRLVPSAEKMLRYRAEKDAINTLHAVFWESGEAERPTPPNSRPTTPKSDRLAQIAQQERMLSEERKLIEAQASPNQWRRVTVGSPKVAPTAPSLSGYEMGVLLCTYAALGWKEQLEEMLSSGVDVNTGDYDNRTALHLASGEGHVDIVKILLQRGANVNCVDRMGFSPLVDACRHQHVLIQNMLKEAGGKMLGTDVSVAVTTEAYPDMKKPSMDTLVRCSSSQPTQHPLKHAAFSTSASDAKGSTPMFQAAGPLFAPSCPRLINSESLFHKNTSPKFGTTRRF